MNTFQNYRQSFYCMLGDLQTNFEFEEYTHFIFVHPLPPLLPRTKGCTGDWGFRQTRPSCTHEHPDPDTFPSSEVGTAAQLWDENKNLVTALQRGAQGESESSMSQWC